MAQPAFSGRLVGYARVSTDDQDLSLQMDSLIGLGVSQDDIFSDKASGVENRAPGVRRLPREVAARRHPRRVAARSIGTLHAPPSRVDRRAAQSRHRFPLRR
jgi:predicted site-specific integrase-resolvase